MSDTAISAFLRYLKQEHVTTAFGVVGGLTYPLFQALELDPDIKLVTTKHEQGAAFMADGYARVGRRLGLCISTAGPGATNLLTGVACSFADGVPVLVVTGQVATHAIGKGASQEVGREDIDVVGMFKPITKYSATVTEAASLGRHVRRALRLALTGRMGPVHLNVPVDIWSQKVEESWFSPSTYRPHDRTFDRLAVQQAGDLLFEAQNPVILVGSGVGSAQAEQHVAELAGLIDARVATTPRAKGLFPEDNERSLGVLGLAGHQEARSTILGGPVDVLMSVGASLNETTTLNWSPLLRPKKALIQLDIDVDRIARSYPVDLGLIGDAQSILVELLYHVHRRIRDGATPQSIWSRWKPIDHSPTRFLNPEELKNDSVPLSPARWRAELIEHLPTPAVVFSDVGGHMLFNLHYLVIGKGQRFVLNLGFGSMGHGTVAPIGASLADPSLPVVAIVGDGCFQMNGMELLTAVEQRARVVWIVENNQMHGITHHISMKLSGGRPLAAATSSVPCEIAGIARAMGMSAAVVARPGEFAPALQAALATRGPALLEIRTNAATAPPAGERTSGLSGFMNR